MLYVPSDWLIISRDNMVAPEAPKPAKNKPVENTVKTFSTAFKHPEYAGMSFIFVYNGWSLEIRTTIQSDFSSTLHMTHSNTVVINIILKLIQNVIGLPNIMTFIRNDQDLLNNA